MHVGHYSDPSSAFAHHLYIGLLYYIWDYTSIFICIFNYIYIIIHHTILPTVCTEHAFLWAVLARIKVLLNY